MKTIAWFGFVLGLLSAAGEVILKKPGETVVFSCEAQSYSRLTWTHESEQVFTINGRSGFQTKGKGAIVQRSKMSGSNLEVSGVRKEDAGSFNCKADGKTTVHTLLVVSVSASPSTVLQPGSSATLQCQVTGLNPGPTVNWKGPDGSRSDSGTVELKRVAHSHAGKWECSIMHGAVTHNEILEIKVEEPAEPTTSLPSKKSTGGHLPPNGVTGPPSEDTVLFLKLNWWMWVLVGVVGLLVILLIVCVIVLCKRSSRRKRRKYATRQNGHQQQKPRQYCQCNRPAAAAAKPQQGRRREKPLALPQQPLLME